MALGEALGRIHRFLSAPEAVEYGLVDSILTHRN